MHFNSIPFNWVELWLVADGCVALSAAFTHKKELIVNYFYDNLIMVLVDLLADVLCFLHLKKKSIYEKKWISFGRTWKWRFSEHPGFELRVKCKFKLVKCLAKWSENFRFIIGTSKRLARNNEIFPLTSSIGRAAHNTGDSPAVASWKKWRPRVHRLEIQR